ncbi:kininogen-2-like [Protopterus annectens]|uniref:kininogen-2-like n=1 Tax=Protopterus annectens TaxID=7888 RepID=UPI001CFC0EF0|nr:kininogen-2-like [Protopterus annectens]
MSSTYFTVILSLVFALFVECFANPTAKLIQAPLSDLEANAAAESAINVYNTGSDNPFQFKLQRLTSASYKVLHGGEKNYVLKYEMKETICPKGSKARPQSCSFRTEPDTILGVCEAEVLAEPNSKFKVFRTPLCKLLKPVIEEVTVHSVKCTGCPESVSPDDPKVKESVKLALEKYNLDNAENRTFILSKISFATKEVTIGEKIWVSFKIQESSCPPKSRPDSQECLPKELGIAVIGDCQAEVLFLFAGRTGHIYRPPKCTLVHPVIEKGVAITKVTCIGCSVPLHVNDTRVQKSVNDTIAKFNNISQLVPFAMDQVISATHESIAGEEITVHLKLIEVSCPAGHGSIMKKCPPKDSRTDGSAVCLADQKYNTDGNLVYHHFVCNVTKSGQVKPLTATAVHHYEKDEENSSPAEGGKPDGRKPAIAHTPGKPAKETTSTEAGGKHSPKRPEVGQRDSITTKPKPPPKSGLSDLDLLDLL